MNLTQAILLIALACQAITQAHASKPLEGSYSIGGRTVLDPPTSEPQDTHFKIYLAGESAKSLFGTMKVKAKRDICLDDGSTTKDIGNMSCTHHPDGMFDCAFTIDVMRQRIIGAEVC